MYVLLCSVTQLCPTLYNSMGCSLPGSPVHGLFQARKRVGCQCFSRGSSQFRDRTGVSCVSCIGRQILYHHYYLQALIYSRYQWNDCFLKKASEQSWATFWLNRVSVLGSSSSGNTTPVEQAILYKLGSSGELRGSGEEGIQNSPALDSIQ